MGDKLVYEVFNMVTGEWEESVPEQEVMEALDTYLVDYEVYQAEREIISEIIRQRKESLAKERDQQYNTQYCIYKGVSVLLYTLLKSTY